MRRKEVENDVPVNFLTTNDSTGENSGSPVLNGKGELIGLLFDGTYKEPCTAIIISILN